MKSRNPMVGRHAAGTPLAKSGTKPNTRSASRSVPITASHPTTSATRSQSANNYTSQGEQFVKQSPEPFRNPQPSARPLGVKSVVDSPDQKPQSGLQKASPKLPIAAVGFKGSLAVGREKGKVAGRSQPSKSASPFNQGRYTQSKSTKPMFYGH